MEATPNPGHYALVELEKRYQERFLLVTQNVDGLHERAGSERILEMHGRLNTCFCTKCGQNFKITDIDLKQDIPPCPSCGKALRPDIVWFGEMPYYMDAIYAALSRTTVFMTIGTSGNVYPAAYFITMARKNGARTIGVNLERPLNSGDIDEFYQGRAGEILPELVRSEE
jgi:NAD-dependent deacetylase